MNRALQVVILEEQMRQSGNDKGAKTLHRILQNIRRGDVKEEDLVALNQRAVGDLSDPKFDNARFLVQRHSIIALLNKSEIPNMARVAGKRLVKFHADFHAIYSQKELIRLPPALERLAKDMPMKGKSTDARATSFKHVPP